MQAQVAAHLAAYLAAVDVDSVFPHLQLRSLVLRPSMVLSSLPLAGLQVVALSGTVERFAAHLGVTLQVIEIQGLSLVLKLAPIARTYEQVKAEVQAALQRPGWLTPIVTRILGILSLRVRASISVQNVKIQVESALFGRSFIGSFSLREISVVVNPGLAIEFNLGDLEIQWDSQPMQFSTPQVTAPQPRHALVNAFSLRGSFSLGPSLTSLHLTIPSAVAISAPLDFIADLMALSSGDEPIVAFGLDRSARALWQRAFAAIRQRRRSRAVRAAWAKLISSLRLQDHQALPSQPLQAHVEVSSISFLVPGTALRLDVASLVVDFQGPLVAVSAQRTLASVDGSTALDFDSMKVEVASASTKVSMKSGAVVVALIALSVADEVAKIRKVLRDYAAGASPDSSEAGVAAAAPKPVASKTTVEVTESLSWHAYSINVGGSRCTGLHFSLCKEASGSSSYLVALDSCGGSVLPFDPQPKQLGSGKALEVRVEVDASGRIAVAGSLDSFLLEPNLHLLAQLTMASPDALPAPAPNSKPTTLIPRSAPELDIDLGFRGVVFATEGCELSLSGDLALEREFSFQDIIEGDEGGEEDDSGFQDAWDEHESRRALVVAAGLLQSLALEEEEATSSVKLRLAKIALTVNTLECLAWKDVSLQLTDASAHSQVTMEAPHAAQVHVSNARISALGRALARLGLCFQGPIPASAPLHLVLVPTMRCSVAGVTMQLLDSDNMPMVAGCEWGGLDAQVKENHVDVKVRGISLTARGAEVARLGAMQAQVNIPTTATEALRISSKLDSVRVRLLEFKNAAADVWRVRTSSQPPLPSALLLDSAAFEGLLPLPLIVWPAPEPPPMPPIDLTLAVTPVILSGGEDLVAQIDLRATAHLSSTSHIELVVEMHAPDVLRLATMRILVRRGLDLRLNGSAEDTTIDVSSTPLAVSVDMNRWRRLRPLFSSTPGPASPPPSSTLLATASAGGNLEPVHLFAPASLAVMRAQLMPIKASVVVRPRSGQPALGRLALTLSGRAVRYPRHGQQQSRLDADLEVCTDIYNTVIGGWEPLVAPWPCKIGIDAPEFARQDDQPPALLSASISSPKLMSLSVTPSLLRTYSRFMQSTDVPATTLAGKRTIRNNLGVDVCISQELCEAWARAGEASGRGWVMLLGSTQWTRRWIVVRPTCVRLSATRSGRPSVLVPLVGNEGALAGLTMRADHGAPEHHAKQSQGVRSFQLVVGSSEILRVIADSAQVKASLLAGLQRALSALDKGWVAPDYQGWVVASQSSGQRSRRLFAELKSGVLSFKASEQAREIEWHMELQDVAGVSRAMADNRALFVHVGDSICTLTIGDDPTWERALVEAVAASHEVAAKFIDACAPRIDNDVARRSSAMIIKPGERVSLSVDEEGEDDHDSDDDESALAVGVWDGHGFPEAIRVGREPIISPAGLCAVPDKEGMSLQSRFVLINETCRTMDLELAALVDWAENQTVEVYAVTSRSGSALYWDLLLPNINEADESFVLDKRSDVGVKSDEAVIFASTRPGVLCSQRPVVGNSTSSSGVELLHVLTASQVRAFSLAPQEHLALPWSLANTCAIRLSSNDYHGASRWTAIAAPLSLRGPNRRRLCLESFDEGESSAPVLALMCTHSFESGWTISARALLSVSNLLPMDLFGDGELIASGQTKPFPELLPSDLVRLSLVARREPDNTQTQMQRSRPSLVESKSFRSISGRHVLAGVQLIELENNLCASISDQHDADEGAEDDEFHPLEPVRGMPVLREIFARVWVRNASRQGLLARSGGLSTFVESGGLGLIPSNKGDSLELSGEGNNYAWTAPFGMYAQSRGAVTSDGEPPLRLGVSVSRCKGSFALRSVTVVIVDFYTVHNRLDVDLEVSWDLGRSSVLVRAGSDVAIHPKEDTVSVRARPMNRGMDWSGAFKLDVVDDMRLMFRKKSKWRPAHCGNALWAYGDAAGSISSFKNEEETMAVGLGISQTTEGSQRIVFTPQSAALTMCLSNQTLNARVAAIELGDSTAWPTRAFARPSEIVELVPYEPKCERFHVQIWASEDAAAAHEFDADLNDVGDFDSVEGGAFQWRVFLEGSEKRIEVRDVTRDDQNF